MAGWITKKACVIFLALFLSVILFALSSQAVRAEPSTGGWTKTYGGAQSNSCAYALVQTNDGGYALTGETGTDLSGGDFWLVKTDATGNIQWNETYGRTGLETATALVQTGDGGYALAVDTGYYGNSAFYPCLVKTDASGNVQWNKTYLETESRVNALVQTNDGGYALACGTSSNNGNFWLIKTDASGNAQWDKEYGGTGSEVAYALVQTNDGGYALAGITTSFGTGAYLVKTDANGNTQWSKVYGGTNVDEAHSLVQTGDGGYALAGYTLSFGAGLKDAYLVKTDANGNMQWNQTYGGIDDDYAYALVETSDGGYALAGLTQSFGAGSSDFWLVKTDATGNIQWNKAYGETGGDEAHSLVQTNDGGYALAGDTRSLGFGYAWLVKTDGSGVVPEFPSHMILAALLVVASSAVILAKTKFRGSPKKPD